MSHRWIPLILLLLATGLAVGCSESDTPPPVAATNTLLEVAAKDLMGPETGIFRLAGPGACPGRFDIRPSQVRDLRRCRVLLRMDFQKGLDAKLSAATDAGLRIAEIAPGGGLCRPDSYLAACRQTAEALIAAGLLNRSRSEIRLAEIAERLNTAAEKLRPQIAALHGRAVLTSGHQADFCRWLGLKVVGTFSAADTAGPAQLNRAVQAGRDRQVKLVIANRPEGRRVADALAERLGAEVVVFDNFPDPGAGPHPFDALLQSNVASLARAAQP
jgi:zinc transport system substrate-binding protein